MAKSLLWLADIEAGEEVIVVRPSGWRDEVRSFGTVERVTTKHVFVSGERYRRTDGIRVGAQGPRPQRLIELTRENCGEVRAEVRRRSALARINRLSGPNGRFDGVPTEVLSNVAGVLAAFELRQKEQAS